MGALERGKTKVLRRHKITNKLVEARRFEKRFERKETLKKHYLPVPRGEDNNAGSHWSRLDGRGEFTRGETFLCIEDASSNSRGQRLLARYFILRVSRALSTLYDATFTLEYKRDMSRTVLTALD